MVTLVADKCRGYVTLANTNVFFSFGIIIVESPEPISSCHNKIGTSIQIGARPRRTKDDIIELVTIKTL